MITLDTIYRRLQLRLGSAAATNEIPILVCYTDKVGGVNTDGTQNSLSSGTTEQLICSPPNEGVVRDIKYVSVRNNDTAVKIVTITLNDNGDTYENDSYQLDVGDKLQYTHDEGWSVIDKYGNTKTSITTIGIGVTTFPLTFGYSLAAGSFDGSAPVTIDWVSPLTTKGDLFTFSTTDIRLGVGTDGYVLTADSATATGLKWAAAAVAGLPAVLIIDKTTGQNDIVLSNITASTLTTKITDDSGTAYLRFDGVAGAAKATTLASSAGKNVLISADNGNMYIQLDIPNNHIEFNKELYVLSGIFATGGVEANDYIQTHEYFIQDDYAAAISQFYTGLRIGNSTGGTGKLVFEHTVSSYTSTFESGNKASNNIVYVLPITDPTAGQVLSASLPVANVSTLSWVTAGGGTVTSVSGTANRITSTGGATPVINIDAAYDALWQPIDADLTAIAALGFTSTSFLKKTGAGTWALDTNVYLNELGTTIGATTAIQEFTTGIQSAVFNASYILGSFGTGLELIGSTTSKLHLNHSGADVTELGDADNVGNGTRLVIDDANKTIDFYNSTPVFQFNGEAILTDVSTATLTNKSGLISQWTNDAGYLTSAPASTIIVGSTTITGGANGRIPYNSSGFYQESANLVWDNGNSQLSILSSGTASLPAVAISAADIGFYSPAANELAVTTGGSERFRFSSTYFRSPTTGGPNLRRAAGAVGTPTYAFNGTLNTGMWLNGTSVAFSVAGTEYFDLTNDGRLYGKALHDNAGSMTGTANQYIGSGTYTPTLTNTTNIAASTARLATWIRVGNVVTVAGQLDIDPTAAGAVLLGISLPIASNFTTVYQLGGAGSTIDIANESYGFEADATNDRASMKNIAVDTTNHTVTYTFTYEIL